MTHHHYFPFFHYSPPLTILLLTRLKLIFLFRKGNQPITIQYDPRHFHQPDLNVQCTFSANSRDEQHDDDDEQLMKVFSNMQITFIKVNGVQNDNFYLGMDETHILKILYPLISQFCRKIK